MCHARWTTCLFGCCKATRGSRCLLHCAALHFTALHCTLLHFTALHCAVLRFATGCLLPSPRSEMWHHRRCTILGFPCNKEGENAPVLCLRHCFFWQCSSDQTETRVSTALPPGSTAALPELSIMSCDRSCGDEETAGGWVGRRFCYR